MLIILFIKLTKITLYYRTASIDVVGTILLVSTFRALTTTGATDMALETAKAAVASTTAS
jgi:hypothetical protein